MKTIFITEIVNFKMMLPPKEMERTEMLNCVNVLRRKKAQSFDKKTRLQNRRCLHNCVLCRSFKCEHNNRSYKFLIRGK